MKHNLIIDLSKVLFPVSIAKMNELHHYAIYLVMAFLLFFEAQNTYSQKLEEVQIQEVELLPQILLETSPAYHPKTKNTTATGSANAIQFKGSSRNLEPNRIDENTLHAVSKESNDGIREQHPLLKTSRLETTDRRLE